MIKNLKKLISTVAAVAMLASTASVFALDFPDVDESASYANSVEALTALGVVNGDDNGLFNPENTVTRAEFAKMTVEALGEGDAAASSTYTKFADTKGHWAAGYVEAGVSAGFINGYDEDNFGPDDTVQYAQAVKMLVGALGYDVYASKQGGWPSGYLSYGSSLDIINGVSVASNETELTRAQCAVLIFNAMKAPRCIVDGWDISYNGDYLPKYDVKDGDGKEWQTLLTKRNAYVVKGRVTDTSKTGTSLDEGEVTFKVENAENFDGSYYKIATDSDGAETGFTTVTALVGDTDAENMLFTYAEAVLSKDKYTGDWTIVSIVPYGKSETVEFAADDVDVDDATSIADKKVAVFKSATSKNTVKYQLDATPNFYVNGVKLPAGATLAGVVSTYIDGNKTGVVTLVDESKAGSTSVDGKYDHVMITSYKSALVDAVSIKNDSVKISLKDYPVGFASRLTIDLEDEDREVTFVKDGKVISYEDLKEDEVLTIAYDPTAANVNSSKFVEVIVSDAQVSGIATGRSTADNTVTIDGEAYEFIGTLPTDLNKEYTLFIDAFGYVVAYEEGTSTKNIGVVVNMYRDADGETITASVVNGEGKVEKYEVKDEASALAIYKQVVNSDATALPTSTTLISKSVAMANVKNAVIEYSVPSGKLKYTEKVTAANADEESATLTYKEATSKLGSYTIADTTTKFVDLSSYASNNTVGTLSMDTFEDEFDYDGYVFDRNKDGVYNFVIITSGTASLRAESALAVVSAIGSETDIDGTKCTTLVVARNGEEEIEVSVENSVLPVDVVDGVEVPLVKEGSIIAYVVGSEGYVDSADSIKLIYTPKDDYADMRADVVAATGNFGTITMGGLTSSKPVNVYYGPVYTASSNTLQLFTTVNDSHVSNVNAAKAFSLKSANVYTYDYSYKAAKGLRVSTGAPSQSNSIFKAAYTDANNVNVSWTTVGAEDIEPMMAFVREVDGDVTDVVYFING